MLKDKFLSKWDIQRGNILLLFKIQAGKMYICDEWYLFQRADLLVFQKLDKFKSARYYFAAPTGAFECSRRKQ